MTMVKPQFESIFSTKTPLTKERLKNLEKILEVLYLQPQSDEFREPLQYKERGLVNYNTIIQTPMDISTAQKRLKLNKFMSCEECLDMVQTIFQNSFLYNQKTRWIMILTKKCEQVFHRLVKNYLPEVGFKSDSGNKKFQKEIKKFQKLQAVQKKETNSKEPISLSLSLNEKEGSECTSVSMNIWKKNSKSHLTPKSSPTHQNCNTLFSLVKQASKKSLEVLYIMAKNEDMSAISTDRNGNCSIDVESLSKTFISKAIVFLRSEAEREKHVESKEKKKRIKGKNEVGLSRYEV